MPDIDLGLNLYEFNKNAMSQLSPMDAIVLNKTVHEITSEMITTSRYWMLLSNERKDYTVFIMLTDDGTAKELIPTLTNRGQVISIDKQEDGNYEIWIRDPETKENFVYYLFNYSFGIIEA
jgi:hypothetical protein